MSGFLTSRPNLVGTMSAAAAAIGSGALGITALGMSGAGLFGMMAAATLGMYGLGVALTPQEADPATESATDRAWTAPELRERLDALRDRAVGAPTAAAPALAGVLTHLGQLLDRWDVVAGVPDAAHDVAAAITDYVPGTLAAFERIPADLRDTSRRGRATPTQSLTSMFEVLDTHLRTLRDAAYEQDMVALESQGRFLTDKYRQSPLDL